MIKYIFVFIFVAISTCYANPKHTIIMKDGQKYETHYYWYQKDMICFWQNGLEINKPKANVVKIIDNTQIPKDGVIVGKTEKKPIEKPSQTEKPIRNEAGTGITVKDHVACLFKNHLDDMMKFAGARDKASFNAYLNQKKCIVLKGNDKVTIMEYPGMFGGHTKFAYHGVNLWTTHDGITF